MSFLDSAYRLLQVLPSEQLEQILQQFKPCERFEGPCQFFALSELGKVGLLELDTKTGLLDRFSPMSNALWHAQLPLISLQKQPFKALCFDGPELRSYPDMTPLLAMTTNFDSCQIAYRERDHTLALCCQKQVHLGRLDDGFTSSTSYLRMDFADTVRQVCFLTAPNGIEYLSVAPLGIIRLPMQTNEKPTVAFAFSSGSIKQVEQLSPSRVIACSPQDAHVLTFKPSDGSLVYTQRLHGLCPADTRVTLSTDVFVFGLGDGQFTMFVWDKSKGMYVDDSSLCPGGRPIVGPVHIISPHWLVIKKWGEAYGFEDTVYHRRYVNERFEKRFQLNCCYDDMIPWPASPHDIDRLKDILQSHVSAFGDDISRMIVRFALND